MPGYPDLQINLNDPRRFYIHRSKFDDQHRFETMNPTP